MVGQSVSRAIVQTFVTVTAAVRHGRIGSYCGRNEKYTNESERTEARIYEKIVPADPSKSCAYSESSFQKRHRVASNRVFISIYGRSQFVQFAPHYIMIVSRVGIAGNLRLIAVLLDRWEVIEQTDDCRFC